MLTLDDIIISHCYVSKEHPDALGEILREWAFEERYGCYSCFDLIDDFVEVKPTTLEFYRLMGRGFDASEDKNGWGDSDSEILERICWFKHPNGIEVGWYWDGDGILCFYIPELEDDYYNGTLSNSDCKKDNEWEFGVKNVKYY